MRIVLDLQGCQSGSRRRGISRFSLALAKAIARNAGHREVWLLLNDRFPDTVLPLRREFYGLVPPDRSAVFAVAGPTAGRDRANAARARVAEIVREYAIAELNPDVIHVSSLFEGYCDDAVTSVGHLSSVQTAVTLYDHVSRMDPSSDQDMPEHASYRRLKLESLGRAGLVLAVSRSVAREAALMLGISADRIAEVAPAPAVQFVPPQDPSADEEALRRVGLSRPFVLHVGECGPHDNADGLIRAFVGLPTALRLAHHLVLVAPGDEAMRQRLRVAASSVGLTAQDVVFVEPTSVDDLGALYRSCRLGVAPSPDEGLGLTLIEAMACGAPVIGARTGCAPEVIEYDDALFDPSSLPDLAETMRRALVDDALNQSLRRHSVARSAGYSWDEAARRSLDAFDALAAGNREDPADSTALTPYERVIRLAAEWTGALSNQDLMRTAEAIAACRAIEGDRRLLVDVSRIVEHDERTGIQRVVRAISKALIQQPPAGYEVRPVWFDPHTGRYRWAHAFADAVMERPATGTYEDWVEARRGDLFLGLDLAYDRVTRADSWLRSLRRQGVFVVFVVYDTLPAHRPDWFPDGLSTCFIDWVVWIADVSDLLLTISTAMADDLREWLLANLPGKGELPEVRHFHLGSNLGESAPTRGLPDDAPAVLGKLARAPTFLTVGTIEPRKGHRQIVEAFDRLWAQGVTANLVIVGKLGWGTGDIVQRLRGHPEAGRKLFWLEAISDEYLDKVYAASTCLVAASEGEGFGLPLIEAAQHGLPIIARDLPVFREVAGEHAFYFSGASAEILAEALSRWMTMHGEGKAPHSAGMCWLSWAESAQQLMTVVLGAQSDQTVLAGATTGDDAER